MVKPHYAQGNDDTPVLISAEADYHPDEAGDTGFGHRFAEVRSRASTPAHMVAVCCKPTAGFIVGMQQVALKVDYRRASMLAIELLAFEFPSSGKL